MKSVILFIRTTLTGGIMFMLPLTLILILFKKLLGIISIISKPLSGFLPDRILGFDGSVLLAIFIMIVICFIGGLLFRAALVKRKIEKLERNVLSHLPGYSLIKSLTAGAIGEKNDSLLRPVLVKEEDVWKIGLLVEESAELCTVFLPEAPRHDSGEVIMVPPASIKKLDIPLNKLTQILKNFGKGAQIFLKQ